MVKTFKCIGGPLDGHRVTHQYAGPDYTQYNSASGELYPTYIFKFADGRTVCLSATSVKRRFKKLKIDRVITPYAERAVLLYTPAPVPQVV